MQFEADDGLAAGAALCAADPSVDEILICSPDKDLSQCVVASRVICRDRRRRLDRNEEGVIEKFGVPPSSRCSMSTR